MKHSGLIAAVMIAVSTAALAQTDQTPPFFSSGATGYDAQIATSVSGALLRARMAVSNDLKYATVGGQATVAGTPNFTPFSIAVASPGEAPAAPPSATSSAPSVLDRPGMTLLATLKP